MHSAPYPTAVSADQLLADLALAVARNNVGAMRPVHEIVASEGLTMAEYERIAENPTFKKYVSRFEADLNESGFSTRAKSKILMQALFPTMFHMAQDDDVPAAARVKIFENFVELADEKPKNNPLAGAGSGFSITINLPGNAQNGPSSVTISAPATPENTENQALEGDFSPVLAENAPKNPILLLEDDSYEYAGDDIL